MPAPDQSAVTSVLASVADPESGRPLTEMGQVQSVSASAAAIAVTVGLTTHSAILWKPTAARIEELLRTRFPEVQNVAVTVVPHDRPPRSSARSGSRRRA